jgi:hypothetical protein
LVDHRLGALEHEHSFVVLGRTRSTKGLHASEQRLAGFDR